MFSRYKIGATRVVVAANIPVPQDDGTVRDVPLVDPAVDLDASDLKSYKESNFTDLGCVKFKEGEEPTYFTIQPLTRRQKDHADGMGSRQQAAFYMRCSVSKIENMPIMDAAGNVIDAPQPKRKPNGALGAMAQESWLDKIDPSSEFLHALGYMIRTISEARVPLSKPSEPQPGPT